MRFFIFLSSALLPWSLRRLLLCRFLHYELDPTSSISRFSLVLPQKLRMGPHAQIGSCTLCKGLELLDMAESSFIGKFNHITGFPLGGNSRHFADNKDRIPQLILGQHAAITSQHIIDCTDAVEIGRFATIGGFRSQILTHAVDFVNNKQSCSPVTIGDYSFVGTSVTVLPGSALPKRSVLGAKSLLSKKFEIEGHLYAGVPAALVKQCDQGAYFHRTVGFVW